MFILVYLIQSQLQTISNKCSRLTNHGCFCATDYLFLHKLLKVFDPVQPSIIAIIFKLIIGGYAALLLY